MSKPVTEELQRMIRTHHTILSAVFEKILAAAAAAIILLDRFFTAIIIK